MTQLPSRPVSEGQSGTADIETGQLLLGRHARLEGSCWAHWAIWLQTKQPWWICSAGECPCNSGSPWYSAGTLRDWRAWPRSLGRMLGSGQDVGQHIQVPSTTLKCTVQHSTASYKWSLAGSCRYSLSVPGARHRRWDQQACKTQGSEWPNQPGEWKQGRTHITVSSKEYCSRPAPAEPISQSAL